MKIAAYARVSTADQDIENQKHRIGDFIIRRFPESEYDCNVYWYSDIATGKNLRRDGWQECYMNCLASSFDVLIVYELSRITRSGVRELLNILHVLDLRGVRVISVTEPYVDSEDSFLREIMLCITGALNKAETERVRDRTLAGIERARRQGKKLGRPSVMSDHLLRNIWGCREFGEMSIKAISDYLEISYGVVQKVIANELHTPLEYAEFIASEKEGGSTYHVVYNESIGQDTED